MLRVHVASFRRLLKKQNFTGSDVNAITAFNISFQLIVYIFPFKFFKHSLGIFLFVFLISLPFLLTSLCQELRLPWDASPWPRRKQKHHFQEVQLNKHCQRPSQTNRLSNNQERKNRIMLIQHKVPCKRMQNFCWMCYRMRPFAQPAVWMLRVVGSCGASFCFRFHLAFNVIVTF